MHVNFLPTHVISGPDVDHDVYFARESLQDGLRTGVGLQMLKARGHKTAAAMPSNVCLSVDCPERPTLRVRWCSLCSREVCMESRRHAFIRPSSWLVYVAVANHAQHALLSGDMPSTTRWANSPHGLQQRPVPVILGNPNFPLHCTFYFPFDFPVMGLEYPKTLNPMMQKQTIRSRFDVTLYLQAMQRGACRVCHFLDS